MNNVTLQQHLINSRTLTTCLPPAEELQLNPQKNYLFDLSYLGALSVSGKNAIDFLQGQCTADITKVSDIQMVQTAQCNLKGRILSLFDVVQWDELLLIAPQDLLAAIQNSLAKTALLSRVSVQEKTPLSCFGFYVQNSDDLIPNKVFLPQELHGKAQGDGFCYYHLGHGFYIFLVETNKSASFIQPFAAKQQFLGSLTWHTLQLQQKTINIYPESRGLFLPHRLGLQHTSYLSFDKGCYKGQEIIARTHYRATIKHELRLMILNTEKQLFSGQKLFKNTDDVELGELIDYSYLDAHRYLIAVSILKNAPQEFRLEEK